MTKRYLLCGLVTLAIGVILGAFGAHGLESRLSPKYMEIYETGIFYLFIHALGLTALMMYHDAKGAKANIWIGRLFMAGVFLFSGSLLLIALHEPLVLPLLRKFGAVAPIGGLCLIAGWLLAAREISKL